jgi:hypothetical protein
MMNCGLMGKTAAGANAALVNLMALNAINSSSLLPICF